MDHKEREIQELQDRLIELERQLAEARAAVLELNSLKEDRVQAGSTHRNEQQPEEINLENPPASEEHLKEAVLLAPYPLMIQRDDGRVVMINHAWTKITGYTLKDIPTIGEWTRKAYGKREVQTQSLIASKRLFHDGLKKTGEAEVRTRSGEKRIWDISTAPLGVDRKGRRLMVAMGVDITERKRTEEALRISEARYRSLVETAFEGVWIVDTSGRTTFVNRRMAEMLKYDSPADLMDRSAFDFVPSEDLAEIKAKFKERLNKNSLERYDVRLQCRDGTIIWASASANNMLDAHGNITGRMALFMDITRRKQAEEALRRSEERFNKAFHASPGALVISRIEDGRIETINETFVEFFGFSEEEVIGKTSTELGMFVNPEDRQEAVRRLQRDMSVRDFEMDVRLKSGEVRNVSLSIEIISIGGQNTMLTTIQDISRRKRAEKDLRESEQRYRGLFEMMQEGLVAAEVITDENGNPVDYRYLDINPATERQFGMSREEFIGHTFTEVLPDADPEWIEILGRVALTGEPVTVERYGKVTGLWFECHAYSPRRGEFVNILTDITERKQLESALRKRESILIQAGEMAHLGAWDIEYDNLDDLNNNPLIWSDEVYRIFGYAPGEVKASNELFFERVHPEDRVLIQERVAQAIATRQPYTIEHRIIRPDGEVRVVQEHAEIFFDESGKLTHIVGAVQDITEWKRAEERLRESEERFRSLADSMPQLVWTALPDGTVDYYNQRYQEYQEIKQVESETWDWAPVLHPDDLQPTINAWQHSVETGEIYQIEHRVRMADGAYRWHLSRGVPMLDEKGKIIRWFGTATDIHVLKRTEEQLIIYANRLERSNRELEQFAFMASHDLQEPLRKIEMFGDLLLERAVVLNDRERSYLERMRNASGRMRNMVEGLLQLSRVATQGKPFVPVNLLQVTSEVLDDLQEQIQRLGGKVEVKTLPVVEGDPLQLRQLMQNLIGNALKYHEPGTPPEVKIDAKQFNGKLYIRVKDKGIGFHQEDAERIFQPFLRLVGRSQYEGSGMGLAICRRIVERHNGEIVAISDLGQGATFIIILPIYHPESETVDLRKEANDENRGATSHR